MTTTSKHHAVHTFLSIMLVILFTANLCPASDRKLSQSSGQKSAFGTGRKICAGVKDDFACPIEPAVRSAEMISAIEKIYNTPYNDSIGSCFRFLDFDEIPGTSPCEAPYIGLNSWFIHNISHTLSSTTIYSAVLKIKLKAAPTGQTDSDLIAFFDDGVYLTSAAIRNLPQANGTWAPNQSATFVLNLGNMPSAFSVTDISQNAKDGDIGIVVGNETGVDWICLSLKAGVNVRTGWNLVSYPGRHPAAVVGIFPTATSTGFAYSGGYVGLDTARPGTGFWLKFSDEQTVVFEGEEEEEESDTTIVLLQEGWNLAGSHNLEVPISNIQSEPGGLVTSQFFGFETGYRSRDTVQPGRAYWVKASQTGTLILTSIANDTSRSAITGRISIVPTSENPPPPPVSESLDADLLPTHYELKQSYPSPFNPSTTISFDLPEASVVSLKVHDVLGREVAVLLENRMFEAGRHSTVFRAENLASGFYFYRLTAHGNTESFSDVKKVLLLR